ncbi:hypothetical protein EH230_07940 [Flavobacterium columnare]|uniref:Uncharacterized protein n=1 Tax=Flavobacterium columnare TaxID=996 RepID=A0A437UB80_9FLAO|nr:hypothetical protein [Flavobacterium columnare]RVU90829.1 hypothetical protein EH230_07910 [Flavobacterium columnare]RVU90835.1 hypothetical protein EH230_07940 [Flavobacterium columnare]
MVYFDEFLEIVTSESLYGKPNLCQGDLIIPFINLAISNHQLNLSDELKYLNYSYVVCKNVVQVKLNGSLIYENNGVNFKTYGFVYLSGSDFFIRKEVVEFSILCENKFLRTLDYTLLSNSQWEINVLDKNILKDFLTPDSLILQTLRNNK